MMVKEQVQLCPGSPGCYVLFVRQRSFFTKHFHFSLLWNDLFPEPAKGGKCDKHM